MIIHFFAQNNQSHPGEIQEIFVTISTFFFNTKGFLAYFFLNLQSNNSNKIALLPVIVYDNLYEKIDLIKFIINVCRNL